MGSETRWTWVELAGEDGWGFMLGSRDSVVVEAPDLYADMVGRPLIVVLEFFRGQGARIRP